MSKKDSDFINLSEDHELKNWLRRNGFRQTQNNVDELINIIKNKIKKNSSDNVTWKELDDFYKDNKTEFSGLEKV